MGLILRRLAGGVAARGGRPRRATPQPLELQARGADTRSAMATENQQLLARRAEAIELLRAGRAGDSQRLLAELAQQNPSDASLHHQLGDAAAWAGDLSTAITALRRAVDLQPALAPAWARLGNVLRQAGDADGAIEAFQKAAQLEPTGDILANLADALVAATRPDDAIAVLQRALQSDPAQFIAAFNLGCARMRLGQVNEAIATFESLLDRKPESANVHFNLAIALLRRGDFSRGWREFEWRFQLPPAPKGRQSTRAERAWTGEPLDGRTILLHGEQGFGDVIQFARFVPEVAARGRRVILSCRPSLHRLMESLEGVDQVVDSSAAPLAFDVQCPLMSLPLVLGTTMETIPAKTPYLSPPKDLIATWADRLGDVSGMKVGLAWSGSPTNTLNRYRSCPFELLAPLFDVQGVAFFTLQKDAGAEQLRRSPFAARVIDHTPQLTDWAETAALVTNLDLIITIDTGVAHLAGALGRLTWTMLSVASDWRWHLQREDSPWYPTMRLFRQRKLNDWGEVVKRVAEELTKVRRN